ncbi:MAG: polyphosphate polymerase domain-containing protein [Cyclobacteriaceae bacterium]
MNRSSTDYRYERKFIIPTKHYPLSLFLKTLKVPFREVYPPRIINNVYFDTADFQSYTENVHGKANRMKVRMRWYDELIQGKQYYPKLEFKIKRALLGTKKVYALLAVAQREALLNKKSIYDNLVSTALPADVLHDMKTRQPVLINRYKRRYFESLEGQVRITLDTDISFRRFGTFNTKAGFSYNTPDILELKYDTPHDAHGQQIGSMFPFRMTKFSKYQLGMERTFFGYAH